LQMRTILVTLGHDRLHLPPRLRPRHRPCGASGLRQFRRTPGRARRRHRVRQLRRVRPGDVRGALRVAGRSRSVRCTLGRAASGVERRDSWESSWSGCGLVCRRHPDSGPRAVRFRSDLAHCAPCSRPARRGKRRHFRSVYTPAAHAQNSNDPTRSVAWTWV